MPTAVLPIIDGQIASSEDIPGYARVVTNWHVDQLGFNRTRPGITNAIFDPTNNANASGVNTNIIGMYVWTNPQDRYDYLVYVRADRQIFAKNLSTLVKSALSSASDVTTQLDGNSARVTWAEDSGRIMIAGGGQIQTWTGVAGTLSARLAVYSFAVNQPPLGATFITKLANYVVANNVQPGMLNQFFWSQIGDGVDGTWPPLNFNTADARPDPVLAVLDNLRELYIFGSSTVQVYGISGDATLPFQASSTLDLGTIAPYSIVRLDQTFVMLDSKRRFVQTDGRSYTVISTPIAKTIRDLATVADCFGFRAVVGFWDLLVWIFPTAKQAFYFDQTGQKWGTWKGWNGTDDFTAARIGSFVYYPAGNLFFIGDSLFENVFTLDAGTKQDVLPGGTLPIVAERITGHLDQETTKRKRCNSVRLFLRRGLAAGVGAAIEISKRDDDGPWSEPTFINLATQAGDTEASQDWYPGGIYRRRQYRIRYAGAADVVLSKVEEDFSLMTS